MKYIKQFSLSFYIIFVLALVYTIVKTYLDGNDINVYLYAAKHIFGDENIYTNNPFNFYLYSPLFAILLSPIALLDFEIGRVIWGIFNLILVFRLWFLFQQITNISQFLSKKQHFLFTILVAFISIGFINHNLTLGQITILILWLSLEGCYRILFKKQEVLGALLLAIGVNIKIIPIFFLYYLFVKGKIKSVIFSSVFVLASLVLPTLLIGNSRNVEMHKSWFETINPSKSKYVFEKGNGTQSLNAIIPAYFYEFEDLSEVPPPHFNRTIVAIEFNTLKTILQIIRVILALSLLYLVMYKRNERNKNAFYFIWEFAYTCLLIALIFPHQQKYAMLFMIPAGAYVLLHVFSLINNWKNGSSIWNKIGLFFVCFCLFIAGINGRDIIGSANVETLDYFHTFGLVNIVLVFTLLVLKPDLIKLSRNGLHEIKEIQ